MKTFFKWMLVLALFGGGGYAYYHVKVKVAAEDSGPQYDRAVVSISDLRVTVESTGEIAPRNRLDVKPPIAGRVEELLVDEGDAVEKGQILGWISSTERATLLDSALAGSPEEYEYWKKLYNPTPLISPLKGTVIARNFEPGQSIVSGDAVVVIADDLIVIATLDETDIGQVKLGQAVKVLLESYPDRDFDCVVEKIAYDAKTVSNVTMYEVDVRPNDGMPPFARSGMTANLEFVIEERLGVLAVSSSAIQQGASDSGASEGKAPPASAGEGNGDRRQKILERMRASGMSDAEIKQLIAERMQSGGGGRKGGGKRGQSKKGNVNSFVLMEGDDPESPRSQKVEIGISDGQNTEIVSGLEEGDEVLIKKVSWSAKKSSSSSNPLMGGSGRRGPR